MDLLLTISTAPNNDFAQRIYTESSWNTNDQCLALDSLRQIDFIAGRVLNENIEVGELIANFDEGASRGVEVSRWSRDIERQSAEDRGRCHCLVL